MARNPNPTAVARSARRRRGVVLLVVLSLLVLFVIVGLTFALVASVYRGGAEQAARSADREDDHTDELDRAMYLMLRDSERVTPFEHNSLLEDIYADRPVVTTINSAAGLLGGEMLQLDLSLSAA